MAVIACLEGIGIGIGIVRGNRDRDCSCVCGRSQSGDRTAATAISKAVTDAQPLATGQPVEGQFPTMTPNGCFWLRRRQRRMLAVERLALQGIINYDASLLESKLNHLAGEAMCAISTIPALVVSEGYFC